MAWVILRRSALTYSGRLPPPRNFGEWAETDGRAVVTALASKRWFSLFGKQRAAKREIWRELQALAQSGPLVEVLRAAVLQYTDGIGGFAVARSRLPFTTVDLRRLFVVPRRLYNAWAVDAIRARLLARPEMAALKGGPAFVTYFFLEFLSAIDAALAASAPSVHKPLRAGPEWLIVGANSQVTWSVPLRQGPDWRGHYFVYETPPDGVTRARRKQLTACIDRLEAGVSELSRLGKNLILSERPERF